MQSNIQRHQQHNSQHGLAPVGSTSVSAVLLDYKPNERTAVFQFMQQHLLNLVCCLQAINTLESRMPDRLPREAVDAQCLPGWMKSEQPELAKGVPAHDRGIGTG